MWWLSVSQTTRKHSAHSQWVGDVIRPVASFVGRCGGEEPVIIIIDRKSKYFHFVKPTILSEFEHAWINPSSSLNFASAHWHCFPTTHSHTSRRAQARLLPSTHWRLIIHIIFTINVTPNVFHWLNISPYQLITTSQAVPGPIPAPRGHDTELDGATWNPLPSSSTSLSESPCLSVLAALLRHYSNNHHHWKCPSFPHIIFFVFTRDTNPRRPI